jgi:hypothetical protein
MRPLAPPGPSARSAGAATSRKGLCGAARQGQRCQRRRFEAAASARDRLPPGLLDNVDGAAPDTWPGSPGALHSMTDTLNPADGLSYQQPSSWQAGDSGYSSAGSGDDSPDRYSPPSYPERYSSAPEQAFGKDPYAGPSAAPAGSFAAEQRRGAASEPHGPPGQPPAGPTQESAWGGRPGPVEPTDWGSQQPPGTWDPRSDDDWGRVEPPTEWGGAATGLDGPPLGFSQAPGARSQESAASSGFGPAGGYSSDAEWGAYSATDPAQGAGGRAASSGAAGPGPGSTAAGAGWASRPGLDRTWGAAAGALRPSDIVVLSGIEAVRRRRGPTAQAQKAGCAALACTARSLRCARKLLKRSPLPAVTHDAPGAHARPAAVLPAADGPRVSAGRPAHCTPPALLTASEHAYVRAYLGSSNTRDCLSNLHATPRRATRCDSRRRPRPRAAAPLRRRVVQLLGSVGASVVLSKAALLAGPALLYPVSPRAAPLRTAPTPAPCMTPRYTAGSPAVRTCLQRHDCRAGQGSRCGCHRALQVWSPWIRAGMRNLTLYSSSFSAVGLWRAEVRPAMRPPSCAPQLPHSCQQSTPVNSLTPASTHTRAPVRARVHGAPPRALPMQSARSWAQVLDVRIHGLGLGGLLARGPPSVELLIGDPWAGGSRAVLELPYAPRCGQAAPRGLPPPHRPTAPRGRHRLLALAAVCACRAGFSVPDRPCAQAASVCVASPA